MSGRSNTTLLERFSEKWTPEPFSGCWIWTGAEAGDGYGYIRHSGAAGDTYAHRASWKLFRGEIPVGLSVLHQCDTPTCVNPDHLFLGTQKDNIRDASGKGRMRNRRGGG